MPSPSLGVRLRSTAFAYVLYFCIPAAAGANSWHQLPWQPRRARGESGAPRHLDGRCGGSDEFASRVKSAEEPDPTLIHSQGKPHRINPLAHRPHQS